MELAGYFRYTECSITELSDNRLMEERSNKRKNLMPELASEPIYGCTKVLKSLSLIDFTSVLASQILTHFSVIGQ